MRCSVLPPQSNFIRKATVCLLSFIPICAESEAVGMVINMKRKFSIGKLISIIGILILCAGLFFSGIDFISTSSTVFRIIIGVGIIMEVVALVFIFKNNKF